MLKLVETEWQTVLAWSALKRHHVSDNVVHASVETSDRLALPSLQFVWKRPPWLEASSGVATSHLSHASFLSSPTLWETAQQDWHLIECTQSRFCSECANAQAELILRWMHVNRYVFWRFATYYSCYLGPINTRTWYCPFPLIIMSRVLVMLKSLRNV